MEEALRVETVGSTEVQAGGPRQSGRESIIRNDMSGYPLPVVFWQEGKRFIVPWCVFI